MISSYLFLKFLKPSTSAYEIGGDLDLSGFGNLETWAVTPVIESRKAINVVTEGGLSGVWASKSL